MKMCQTHWEMCRCAVRDKGLECLVSADGEEAMNRTLGELHGDDITKTFDPLMSMHWHWANSALAQGGLYLMGQGEDGQPYCPLCEFVKNVNGFDAQTEVNNVADQMATWARSENLIPQVS